MNEEITWRKAFANFSSDIPAGPFWHAELGPFTARVWRDFDTDKVYFDIYERPIEPLKTPENCGTECSIEEAKRYCEASLLAYNYDLTDEYEVLLINTFDATSPEAAVRDMVEYATNRAHMSTYKVTNMRTNEVTWIDADGIRL